MSRIPVEKRNEYQRRYRAKKKKKKQGFTEVSTETLEEIALELINEDHADPNAIKLLLEVWKYKHRVPSASSDDTKIDFGDLDSDTPESIPSV